MAAKAANIDPATATSTGDPSSLTIIHTASPISASEAPSIMPTRKRSWDGDGVLDMEPPFRPPDIAVIHGFPQYGGIALAP